MTLVLLAVLVLVDGAFCGFRAAAGRNPRIFLWPYYARAMRRGLAVAAVVVASFLGAAYALRAGVSEALWGDLVVAADGMVAVYGVYATLVVAALALYGFGAFDLSVLATVLVLGPFTLVRPLVILGGAVFASARTGDPIVIAFAIAAGLVMVSFERILSVGDPPWRGTLPPSAR